MCELINIHDKFNLYDMKIKFALIAVILLNLYLPLRAQQSIVELKTVNIQTLDQLKNYFKYNPKKDIVISGHRGGESEGFPENSIETCENTLRYVYSFFEIDPRLTKDSIFVLMHDADIKRTTNGKGLVSEYTYDELMQFNLKDKYENVTPYKIPTILEMFEWGKGKTVFNLDNKDNGVHTWDLYIKNLKEGGAWYNYKNLILSVRSFEEAMYYWENGVTDRMFCVEISNEQHFNDYDNSPIPWSQIMAYIRYAVDPELEDVYTKLHKKGVSIMISIHPTSDRVTSTKDRRSAYMRELISMPDIIETNHPIEFSELPLSRKELKSLIKKTDKRIFKNK